MSLLFIASTALAATLTVDPSGAGDATTIAAADALLADGDTLVLAAGSHEGCLRLDGRSVRIEGAGIDATTWTGGTCTEQLRARDGEEVVLEGLTLRHPGGRAVALLGGRLDAVDVHIRDSGAEELDGAGIWARSAEVHLERVELTGHTGKLGAALYPWDGGTLTVVDSVVSGNHAVEQGGGIYANGGVAGTITNTVFSGNSSADVSGAVGWHLGSLSLSGVRFEDNTAALNGGALYAHHSTETVVLEDVEFEGNTAVAGRGGALYGAYGSLFQLDRVHFVDNAAVEGADLALVDGALVLQDAVSTGALAERGGLLWLDAGVPARLARVAVCGATADGALAHSAGELQTASVVGAELAGTAVVLDGGTAALSFLGLSGVAGGVVAVRGGSASLDNSVMVDVTGPALQGEVEAAFNDWAGVDEVGAELGEGSFSQDPQWAGGDCGLALALPAATSPLVDAGDPDVRDPDGTRADVGPWGGPESPMVDGDGDGAWTVQDCDDGDATVFPGAPETAGDGVDQDCDGADAQGDGQSENDDELDTSDDQSSERVGEDDGTREAWDGSDRTEVQGRGCGAKPAALPLLWLLLLGLRPRYPRR
jgi:predicted outer membrane repeat protein